MLDCKPELVTALTTILPTYYELFVDSSTATPCITYREYNNKVYMQSPGVHISSIGWYIKIWGDSIEDITSYAQQVDTKLNSLGYTRDSSNELVMGNQICKVMIYSALGKETITLEI